MLEIKDVKEDSVSQASVLEQMSLTEHEQVVFCYDEYTGLKAIVAVHNTVLGPALGGTRMWMYSTESDALKDVLRLSRGMTYKAAITGLNLGGGKAVIIGNSKNKSEALMRRYGRFVDTLNGKYITAEDVGTSPKDMEWVKMETDHVAGLPESMGGSGDPSPVTAYGVYMGMKAASKFQWGSDSLNGKSVLVQGVGHVGESLVNYLHEEGARIYVYDISEEKLQNVVSLSGVEAVKDEDSIYDLNIDIYAPCALGGTLNTETINRLKCSIVAGAANNQLEVENLHGKMLIEKGIVYAPDFLINAGGLINVYAEINGYNRERAMQQTEHIYDVTLDILKMSRDESIPAYVAANRMAEQRLKDIGHVKVTR